MPSRILVLLAYYNRPKMVLGALESLRRQGDAPFRCVMVDDGSEVRGETLVKGYPVSEVRRLEDTEAEKRAQGGSRHGAVMNEIVAAATEEIVLTLCDDDALYDGYLSGLSKWYDEHPDAAWSYGHVSVYDPSMETPPWDEMRNGPWPYGVNCNYWRVPIRPSCSVDSSQVSFRRTRMPPFQGGQTANLDAVIFAQMYDAVGPCPYNGLVAQHKGVHRDQLGNRQGMSNEYRVVVP